jgi:hypothetical protein
LGKSQEFIIHGGRENLLQNKVRKASKIGLRLEVPNSALEIIKAIQGRLLGPFSLTTRISP